MSRPRKSRTELELSGAIKKNPKRFRDRFADRKSPGPIGPPPSWMSPAEKESWREFVRTAPPGALTISERIAVADMSRIWARYVKYGENLGGKSKGATSKMMSRLKDYLARFGMTPLDKTKLHLPEEPDTDNEFAEFAEQDPAGRYNEFFGKKDDEKIQ